MSSQKPKVVYAASEGNILQQVVKCKYLWVDIHE